jgi:hypothetical protein
MPSLKSEYEPVLIILASNQYEPILTTIFATSGYQLILAITVSQLMKPTVRDLRQPGNSKNALPFNNCEYGGRAACCDRGLSNRFKDRIARATNQALKRSSSSEREKLGEPTFLEQTHEEKQKKRRLLSSGL